MAIAAIRIRRVVEFSLPDFDETLVVEVDPRARAGAEVCQIPVTFVIAHSAVDILVVVSRSHLFPFFC